MSYSCHVCKGNHEAGEICSQEIHKTKEAPYPTIFFKNKYLSIIKGLKEDDGILETIKNIYSDGFNDCKDICEESSDLVVVDGLNWRRCSQGHKLILYREMICPMCELQFVAQEEMMECYKDVKDRMKKCYDIVCND